MSPILRLVMISDLPSQLTSDADLEASLSRRWGLAGHGCGTRLCLLSRRWISYGACGRRAL